MRDEWSWEIPENKEGSGMVLGKLWYEAMISLTSSAHKQQLLRVFGTVFKDFSTSINSGQMSYEDVFFLKRGLDVPHLGSVFGSSDM